MKNIQAPYFDVVKPCVKNIISGNKGQEKPVKCWLDFGVGYPSPNSNFECSVKMWYAPFAATYASLR